MSNDRVLVYTTNKLYEAELIQEYLFNNGIHAFILNKMDSAYLFGDIEILVEKDDVIRSKKLIADFLNNE
jgi:hypothetical protein